MSDAGGLGPAWEYDPAADPGNFPLEFVPPLGVQMRYSALHDDFTAEVEGRMCTVGRVALQDIYGLARFKRRGILYGAVETAAMDYFRHEAFLRRLTPAQEV